MEAALSLSASVNEGFSKQFRRGTVGSSNGLTTTTKTQVYYPRQRSFSAGSPSFGNSSKRLSGPSPSNGSTAPTTTSNLKVVRVSSSNSKATYCKAKSLEESKTFSTGNNNGGTSTCRYKTELCRPFQEYGFCKYSDKCQFAHGEQDLRCLPRHPKYKTELCRTYHTRGFCPYGTRCHFIHSMDEIRNEKSASTSSSSNRSQRKISQTSLTFSLPMSPSLDSGISSPDDFHSYPSSGNQQMFEFPGSEQSSGSSSEEGDCEYYSFGSPNCENAFSSSGSRSSLSVFESDESGICTVGGVPHHYQREQVSSPDTFPELDGLSTGSGSPTKHVSSDFSPPNVSNVSDMFNCMNLESDGSQNNTMRTSSGHRLPVFDNILSTKSEAALLDQTNCNGNSFNLFPPAH